MGKSLTATLLGVLIRQGAYRLDQPAPIPEWQAPGDPRQRITITDLLQMSSGLGAGPRPIPTSIPPARTPTTSISTPAASIRSIGRRRGRCSGCRARSAAIATSIPCW